RSIVMATEVFLQQLMTNPDRLNRLAEDAKELALFHGIIMRTHETPNSSESIVVGLNRSDYLLDQRDDGTTSLKQIEINTISAGGFGTTDRLPIVHRHTLKSVGLLKESESIPDTNSITSGMTAVLAKGWELYGQPKAVILFLVEDIQISRLSHHCMEKELWNRNIPVIRRRFEEVSRRASLDDDKKLFIDGLEVALVYFRYGYMPDNYTEE
ncbi:Glutathione synthetase, partial [Nibea albiflora]